MILNIIIILCSNKFLLKAQNSNHNLNFYYSDVDINTINEDYLNLHKINIGMDHNLLDVKRRTLTNSFGANKSKLIKSQVVFNTSNWLPSRRTKLLDYRLPNVFFVNAITSLNQWNNDNINFTGSSLIAHDTNFKVDYMFKLFYNFKALTTDISNIINKNDKFSTKKTLFSFLKKNQYERKILQSKQRINFSRFCYSQESFNTTLNYFSSVLSHTNLDTYDTDLSISRVRFKPGYQRLWREARSTIALSLRKKYTYQQQLTKYISNISRTSKYYQFSNALDITDLLIRSQLVPDKSLSLSLLNLHFVFLNGIPVSNALLTPVVGDNIQLRISSWFYIYSKWLLAWSFNNTKSLRRLIFRKTLRTKFIDTHKKKQRSNTIPSSVLNHQHTFMDSLSLTEVDFFTLSIFVVHSFDNDTRIKDYLLKKNYIYKNYNWKYIN